MQHVPQDGAILPFWHCLPSASPLLFPTKFPLLFWTLQIYNYFLYFEKLKLLFHLSKSCHPLRPKANVISVENEIVDLRKFILNSMNLFISLIKWINQWMYEWNKILPCLQGDCLWQDQELKWLFHWSTNCLNIYFAEVAESLRVRWSWVYLHPLVYWCLIQTIVLLDQTSDAPSLR